MKDKKVLNLGPHVVQGFKEPATEGKGTQLDNLVAVVEQSWRENRQPMIALKSGIVSVTRFSCVARLFADD